MAEIKFWVALNKKGRGLMRSMMFQPQKIPDLLKCAVDAESGCPGHYLYPLLRENPFKWIGYLAQKHEDQQPMTLAGNHS